jgi:acyl carrier protein
LQPLEAEIARFVIETLNLEDLRPEDIDPEAPLFVKGLGLDSIDALELGVGLQKRYGIKLSADSQEVRQHFASVRALAALVGRHREQGTP